MAKQAQNKNKTNSSSRKNSAYKIFLAAFALIIILAMVLSMIRF